MPLTERDPELAENLHRAELTVQERSDQIARWVDLCEQKLQLAQLGPIESKRPDGRGDRKESRDRQAARELNLNSLR